MAHFPSTNGISLLESDESSPFAQMHMSTDTPLQHSESYKHKLPYFLFKHPFIPPSPPDYRIPLRQIHSIASKLVALYSVTPLSKDVILTLFDYLWTNHFTPPFTNPYLSSKTPDVVSNAPRTHTPGNPTFRYDTPNVYIRLIKTWPSEGNTVLTSSQSGSRVVEIINTHQSICSSITATLSRTASLSSRPSSRQGRSLSRISSRSSLSSRSPSPSSFLANNNYKNETATLQSNTPLPYTLPPTLLNVFVILTEIPESATSPVTVAQTIRDVGWNKQDVILVWSSDVSIDEMDGDADVVSDAEDRGYGKWMCKQVALGSALELVIELAQKMGGGGEVGNENSVFHEED